MRKGTINQEPGSPSSSQPSDFEPECVTPNSESSDSSLIERKSQNIRKERKRRLKEQSATIKEMQSKMRRTESKLESLKKENERLRRENEMIESENVIYASKLNKIKQITNERKHEFE